MTVFDGFPFLEGRYLNYAEYFGLCFMILMFLISFGFFLLYLFFKWLERYFRRKDIISSLHSEEVSNPILSKVEAEDINQAITINRMKNELDYQRNTERDINMIIDEEIDTDMFGAGAEKVSKKVKVCYWIAYVCSLMSVFFLSMTPVCWSGLGLFPIAGSIFIMLAIFYCRFFSDIYDFCPQAKKKLASSSNNENWFLVRIRNFARINLLAFRNLKVFFIIANIMIIFWSIFIPFFFENTCISLFNPPIGFYISGYIDISTKFTRHISENDKCPPGPPCHFYATLPENSTTSVFINVHTNTKYNDVIFKYDEKSFHENYKTFQYNVTPSKYVPVLESRGERHVFSGLINNLKPNTEYIIGVFYGDEVQETKVYKTLPDVLGENDTLTIINGGDVGSASEAEVVTKSIIQTKPRAIFIGGDVAYDDGMTSCYHTWDSFLWMMEDLNTALNYLVPLVLGVGNHDVGLNNESGRKLDLGDMTPLFLQYFPQHYKRDSNGTIINGIPDIPDRKTYFYHTFSNIIYLSLDSGYVMDFRGEQLEWMNATFNQFSSNIKFVQYHVPTYSSCVNKDHDKTHNIDALLFWNPIFDYYHVMTSFENHVHLFKRTWKLKGNQIDQQGTLFLGDGCWGVQANLCEFDVEPKIFAKISKDLHVWVTDINNTGVRHRALGMNASFFDEDYQKIEDYIF